MENLPEFKDILAAKEALLGKAHITPVATCTTIDRMMGTRVFFKCENLQKIGAFKFRGAYNAISRLTQAQREKGIITFSSGNHAQAVALASRMFDARATIIMPDDAPKAKSDATKGYGGSIVTFDQAKESREDAYDRCDPEKRKTLVPPFDHPHVIAGQGTSGLELYSQIGCVDTLLVPCGGGGLLSGVALAYKTVCPNVRIIGVEPETADDATKSFKTGKLHSVHNPSTIADGTKTPCLGNLTFALIRRLVDDMVTVTETAIAEAVRLLYFRAKLVVEPSGALGLAALLENRAPVKGRTGIVLSGGNVNEDVMARIIAGKI